MVSEQVGLSARFFMCLLPFGMRYVCETLSELDCFLFVICRGTCEISEGEVSSPKCCTGGWFSIPPIVRCKYCRAVDASSMVMFKYLEG